MKIVTWHSDTWVTMECSRGHKFDVDPHTEENLIWYSKIKSLIPKCPTCGEVWLHRPLTPHKPLTERSPK